MESQTPAWVNMLISWAPFLLLIGFWLWFMRKGGSLGRQAKYVEQNLLLMERQQELLERIAVALEQRSKSPD